MRVNHPFRHREELENEQKMSMVEIDDLPDVVEPEAEEEVEQAED
jgi:hypothetical protein